MSYTLKQLAEHLEPMMSGGVKLHGDADIVINGVATIGDATHGQITFVTSNKYRDSLRSTSASAVIIRNELLADTSVPALIVDNPRAAFAHVVEFINPVSSVSAGIHPSAIIDPTANISATASIGANTVIEANVEIADAVQIDSGCVVGRNSRIGMATHLLANVSVYHDCDIGESCILHSSSVIGSDGFGFEFYQGEWLKIPQVGGVTIGNKVEIGACSVVDRGALNNTVIEDGVKLDNHVQIAHNVKVGQHTVMSRGVGVAGSSVIGKNCIIAGMVGIKDNIEITDNVIITAMTMVTSSIKQPGSYSSPTPMDNTKSWRKNSIRFKQLDDMAKQIRQLKKIIENNT